MPTAIKAHRGIDRQFGILQPRPQTDAHHIAVYLRADINTGGVHIQIQRGRQDAQLPIDHLEFA